MVLAATGLLTTAEVAAVFGVRSGTVRKWVRAGQLRAYRTPGGTRGVYRFHVDDLNAVRGQPVYLGPGVRPRA